MYFRDVQFLGSMTTGLPQPDESFDERGFFVECWNFTTDSSDNMFFQKKTKITYDEMLDDWLIIFSEVFPDNIITDARRFVFDLNVSGKYPSNIVLGSIVLACSFHNYDFKQHFKEVCAILGKKRKANKKVTKGEFLYRNLMHEAEDFKKLLGKKKFKELTKMWKCLNDAI